MAYTILNVKSDLSGRLKGTSTDKIPDILSILKLAGRQLLLDIDPEETRRVQQISNALYEDIYDYPLPADLKGNKIIDIRPLVNRDEKFIQRNSEAFDFDKEKSTFNVKYNSGVKSIRIAANLRSPKTLDDFSSLTSGGTWTAGDDATNITLDTLNYVQGSSSINFDLDGSTTDAYIEKTYSTAIDLSDDEDKSSLFLWIYLPDASIMTSVELRWGNSSTIYFSNTVTQANSGAFVNGWNQLRFDWNGATETGSVDTENIDYVRITVNYDGTADTDLRVDNLTVNLGAIYELEHYSKYLFKNSSGTWQEDPSDDSDIVNLDTDSYNIYLDKVSEYACQTVQKLNSDVPYFRELYDKGVTAYQSDRKSEAKKTQEVYYLPTKR